MGKLTLVHSFKYWSLPQDLDCVFSTPDISGFCQQLQKDETEFEVETTE